MAWQVEEGAFGPRTARLFQSALAVNALFARLSLGVQVEVLIGSRGLLPIARLMANLAARAPDAANALGYFDFPTLFWWGASDTWIIAGVWLGVVLSFCALIGLWPRVAFTMMVPTRSG